MYVKQKDIYNTHCMYEKQRILAPKKCSYITVETLRKNVKETFFVSKFFLKFLLLATCNNALHKKLYIAI